MERIVTDRLQWFREASYGMFIHWGLYAVPAGAWGDKDTYGEWIQQHASIPGVDYEKLAGEFNPAKFNAAEWVGLARDSGMKYMVVTAKHHEGFCMFDSKLTDFTIVRATPYGRDPMRDLASECAKAGITLCFYYSVKDWHHPQYPTLYTRRTKQHPDGFHGFPNPNADYHKYLDYLEGQVSELLTNYGPIGIIWFDISVDAPAEPCNRERALRVIDTIHRLQPACLINNRFGELGADYGTPEQYIPQGKSVSPFEVCMTLNNHWGYNHADNQWKDAATVVRNLTDIRAKGGNYLLNAGPTAEGIIPKASCDVFREAGRWLSVNGESIYGAMPMDNKLRPEKTVGAVTQKPGRYYLHMFSWPQDKNVFLINFYHAFRRAYFLADPSHTPLNADVYRRSVLLYLPEKAPDPLNSVIVVEWGE